MCFQICQAIFVMGTSPLERLDWQRASRLIKASQRGCPFPSLLEIGSYRIRLIPRLLCGSQRAQSQHQLAHPLSHSCFLVNTQQQQRFPEACMDQVCCIFKFMPRIRNSKKKQVVFNQNTRFNMPKSLYLIRQIYP